MALMFLARFFHHGLIMFLVSTFCLINCQPNSPQNIETHYPYYPPPSPSPSPAVLPPPEPPIIPSTPPPPVAPSPRPKSETGTNNRAIATAVVATAASTLVFSGLLFFLLRARSLRRKKGENGSSNGGLPMLSRDQFTRFDGNIKGLIVDESGLDILYWRKLQDKSENKRTGKKESHDPENETEGDEGVEGTKPRGKRIEPIQEIPFLRGRSSTSHVNPAAIKGGPNVTLAPEGIVLKAVEEPNQSTQSPTPRRAPLESPESITLSAIPANSSPPTPPPPPTPPTLPIKTAPAPPPPPPPPKVGNMAVPSKAPPPPLPKPMPGGSSSGKGQVETGQVKLKPLHWDKVNPNGNHSMVWNKIEGGSFKFDDDLMGALFGCVATNRKSPKGTDSTPNPGNLNPRPSGRIFILDTRKSQNIAIVLKSLSVSRKEIIDALTEGQGLDTDTLDRLNRIAPTKEEESLILQFGGDPTRLADAESFLYHLLKAMPSAFTRFSAMLFRLSYESEISSLKETLQTLELGCGELRKRGLFMKLLEAILKAGNRMNAGTARGNAQAFDLTALRKLSDVKSMDGKTTLLNFVVEEVVRAEGKRCVVNRNNTLSRTSSQSSGVSTNSENSSDQEKEYMMLGLPVVGGLSTEFSNAKKAASIDYESFTGSCAALTSRVSESREVVSQCTNDGGGFIRVMQGFLHSAESELNALRKQQTIVMDLVERTTEYYQGGAAKDKAAKPLQLFFIIKDFLGMVDHVCVEITRNLQRKKSSTGRNGSSPPRSYGPRTVRFPNLPPHFLSGKS